MVNFNEETLAGTPAPSKFISAIFDNKVPEGLTVTEREWENEYRGTEAAFIEAGLIKPEWLPGHLGNTKRTVTVAIIDGEMKVLPPRSRITDYQWENGYICITKLSKGRLVVSVNCLEEEHKKREKVVNLERKKKLIAEVRKEIDKGIAELPTSPEAYVGRGRQIIRAFANGIRSSLTDNFGYSGGYSFPSELIAEFDSAAAHFNQMIKDSLIDFDHEKRRKEIAGIKNKVLEKYQGLTEKDLAP